MATVGVSAEVAPLVATELNYLQYKLDHSQIQYNEVTPNNSSTTVNIDTNGGNTTIFEIPPQCMNLSKSYLAFTSTIPVTGALAHLIFADGAPMIREIRLTSRSGAELCNLKQANRYMKVALRREISKKEAETFDAPVAITASTTGFFEGLTYTTDTNRYLTATRSVGDGTASEPAYLMASATSATSTLKWRLCLGTIFKNTIFALNRMIAWPEALKLTIVWDSSLAMYMDSDTVLSTGTLTAAVATVPLTNLRLQIAQEQNIAIKERLQKMAMDGQTISYDWVDTTSDNRGTSTSHNPQFRYGNTHGKALKKFYLTAFSAAAGPDKFYDHSNIAAAKITSYYAALDGVRLMNGNYIEAATNQDSFSEQRERLKGSNLATADQFYYNWAHEINFESNYSHIDRPIAPAKESFVDGLPLNSEHIIDFKCTTPSLALNWFAIAVCTRDVIIQNGKVTEARFANN